MNLSSCSSVLFAELQPRVRGWLLASVDGQTTGLVPANYVKVLGKRRGRKHAEQDGLTQAQQSNPEGLQNHQPALATCPGPTSVPNFTPVLYPGSASTQGSSEELLESVYRETEIPLNTGAPYSSIASSTVLTIPERIDL